MPDSQLATPDWVGRRAVVLFSSGSGMPDFEGTVDAVSECGEYVCIKRYSGKDWHRSKFVRLAAIIERKPDVKSSWWRWPAFSWEW